MFLKEKGYPWHGHLHTGNVFVDEDDVTCAVGGHENTLIELPSKFLSLFSVRSDLEAKVLDVLCFGINDAFLNLPGTCIKYHLFRYFYLQVM